MNNFILQIQNLNKSFGGLNAIKNLSFNVSKGLVKAVIGPNGAGKTTLFNLISGSLEADSGNIFFDSNLITGLKPYKIAEIGVSRTFQTTKLFGHMTVLENIMVGRHIKTKSGFLASILNFPSVQKEERALRKQSKEILGLFDISDLSDEYAQNLSFGKQRLVEFARACAMEPKLLLLDEPAAGLNIRETEEIARLILKIRDWGITVLLVEHDMSMVMDISDEIVVLNQGAYLAEGSPPEIQKNTEVIKVYLGDDDA